MSVFVRVRIAVLERVKERLTEWEHALLLIALGVILWNPPYTNTIPNEPAWGQALVVLGILRFGSLVVNGWRGKITSWLRGVAAFLGSWLFAVVAIGYFWAGRWEPGIIFGIIAAFELLDYARAMFDVGKAQRVQSA